MWSEIYADEARDVGTLHELTAGKIERRMFEFGWAGKINV